MKERSIKITAETNLSPGTIVLIPNGNSQPKKVVILSGCYAPDGSGVELFNGIELKDGQPPSIQDCNVEIKTGKIVQILGKLKGKKDLRQILLKES